MSYAITQTYTSPKPLPSIIQVPNALNIAITGKAVSYSTYVLDGRQYEHVDISAVRQLVAECLYDDVMERLPLGRLLTYINASIQGQANGWTGLDSTATVQA